MVWPRGTLLLTRHCSFFILILLCVSYTIVLIPLPTTGETDKAKNTSMPHHFTITLPCTQPEDKQEVMKVDREE